EADGFAVQDSQESLRRGKIALGEQLPALEHTAGGGAHEDVTPGKVQSEGDTRGQGRRPMPARGLQSLEEPVLRLVRLERFVPGEDVPALVDLPAGIA